MRVRACNRVPVREDGEYILYWMIAARRAGWNFALQRAVEHAARLGRPLVVLEALRSGYRWASERLHAFVIEGMADNARAFAGTSATYIPYVEPEPGAGKGMVKALAARACVVVTADRVIARNARMSEGSESLWEYARSLIEGAVAQGHLAPTRT